jgi:hypothetical protein
VPAEFITLSLFIAQATKMTDDESITTRIEELMELEEAIFLAGFSSDGGKGSTKGLA